MSNNWLIINLEEIVDIYQGTGFPKMYQGKKEGKYPFFKVLDISNNVREGSVFLKKCKNYIDEKELKLIKGKIVPKYAIVFAKIGEALKLNRRAITLTESLIDNNTIGIRNNKRVCDLLYLYYYFKIVRLEDYSRATTVPSVRKSDIQKIKINLPPLPEQHEIVRRIEAMFSELDNSIESLKKAWQQLKTYRQAVLKHAFEGKLTEKWREQQTDLEPAEDLLEKIKAERQRRYEEQLNEWEKAVKKWEADGKEGTKPKKPQKPKELPELTKDELKELAELPDGWRWSYLDYIGSWRGGGTPSKQNQNFWNNGSLLWVSPKDMKYQYVTNTLNKITEEAVKNSSANIIPEFSILYVVRSGILRRILPVSINRFKCTVNQDLQALTPLIMVPEFIYWYSVSNEFDIRHKCAKDGTTVESMRTYSLKNYPIRVTSIKEQHQIVQEIEQRLSVADNLEKSIEDSLQKAEALRQSILKQAFEGKLTEAWRKKHPELVSGENSAEKLLERIQEEKENVSQKTIKKS